MGETLIILFAALVVDRLVGDPDWLWRRVPHPVVGFGRLIGWADARFNDPATAERQREKYGFIAIAALLVGAAVLGSLMDDVLEGWGGLGLVAETLIVAVFLAQKSLADHVGAVARGLRGGGLEGGRRAVAQIVGRDPETLDEAGVSRAAIETLAENASDGVVAPAFWYAVFGLPGLFAYKMLNTADSMIGHRTERHRAFGRASARLDDLGNWLPARLTALLIVIAGGWSAFRTRWDLVMRDAKLHRSPNAGWPESAMAVVTGLSLGGPRVYRDDVADEPFMNDAGRKDAGPDDIDAALVTFWRTMTALTAVVGVLAVLAG
ncbi:adenosylcobinamide-phosphate synthase CbiB [Roseitalea porphyridii]|uniref:Cobalamin biosynthesis protein CobD n=1 Tax=Roseitalea porphyridii TaxID=1852022 RepID=A0A4P6V1T5_9HYPH|nr:adenosylcobinamide-phosphate synthase CbiB [Roseitalea porphyridii]QBK31332.1 cobalamin biosynthesis protein [Roseitalea porphyridii]